MQRRPAVTIEQYIDSQRRALRFSISYALFIGLKPDSEVRVQALTDIDNGELVKNELEKLQFLDDCTKMCALDLLRIREVFAVRIIRGRVFRGSFILEFEEVTFQDMVRAAGEAMRILRTWWSGMSSMDVAISVSSEDLDPERQSRRMRQEEAAVTP